MNNETLNQVFSNTANSIRTKLGSTDKITPTDFANRIIDIPTPDGIYKVPSITERDLIDAQEGDICLVYDNEPLSSNDVRYISDVFLPDTIEFDESLLINGDYINISANARYYCKVSYSSSTHSVSINLLNLMHSRSVAYETSDGLHWTLNGTGGNFHFSTQLNNYYYKTQTPLLNFVQIPNISFDNIFIYKDSIWKYLDINIDLDSNYLFSGNKAYTSNGIITGSFFGEGNEANTINELERRRLNLNTYLQNITNAQGMYSNLNTITNIYQTLSFSYINTGNIIDMSNMFYNCRGLTSIPNFDTSKCTNMSYMFKFCTNITNIPNFNTSNCTDMSFMFDDINATSIPNFDTSKCTNIRGAFSISTLTSIPNLNTCNCVDMGVMLFRTNITSVPNFNTCSCANFERMLLATKITTSPAFNTSSGTNTYMMYGECNKLTTAPTLNLTNVEDCSLMFSNCTSLTTVPVYNIPNCVKMNSMFSHCNNLSTSSLNNILKTCITATNINSNNKSLLNNILTNTSYTTSTLKSLSEYQNFISAGWTL